MITSQSGDYRILRQLDMSEKRVRHIMWRQFFLYLFLGIGFGIALGIVITALLTYRETDGKSMELNFYMNNIAFLLLYYAVLLGALIPHVRRSARIYS